MTKNEAIQKIEEACQRVLKQANYAEGVVSALTVVITRLTGVRDELAKAPEMDPNLHQMLFDELYECGRVIGSIYDGFPMVPAESSGGGEETTKMAVTDVAKFCVEKLEQAAAEKGLVVGPAVAHVLCLARLWKAAGEQDPEGAELLVPTVESMARLAREDADRRAAAKAAAAVSDKPAEPAPAEQQDDDPIVKLDSIAKLAAPAIEPAPAAAPPAAQPSNFIWPTDLNRRK